MKTRTSGLFFSYVMIILLAAVTTSWPAAAQETVQFSDDFSVVSDRWNTGSWSHGAGRYEDNAMLVRANHGHGSIFIEYDQIFSDLVIEVDMTLVNGTDDNWQTVSCRHSSDSYYDLGISADGFYLIDVWIDGNKLGHSLGPTRSGHINLGRNVVNRVRAECIGNVLRLFANGNFIAELTDDNLTDGRIALSVDSPGRDYSEVAFDNLVVTTP